MPNNSKFTEARLEQAIIKLLGLQGYPHVTGDELVRKQDEVLIKADLVEFLARRYAKDSITKDEIQSILRQLEMLPAVDLYGSNKVIMKMISDRALRTHHSALII